MRSHLTNYVRGVHGATELRRLMTSVETYDDIKRLLDDCLERLEAHRLQHEMMLKQED